MAEQGSIWTRAFWKATGERVISTVAQSGVASLTVVSVAGGGVTEVAWAAAGSIAALAGVLSLLKSLAANTATGTGPSFTEAEQTVAPTEVVVDEGSVKSPAQLNVQPATERTVDLTDVPVEPVVVDEDGDGRDDRTGRYVPKGPREQRRL